MPETVAPIANPAPLTSLTEDEVLFRDNVRQFAEERVRPLAKEMDEKGVFEKELIHQFFQLGLMASRFPDNTVAEAADSSKPSSPSRNLHAPTAPPGPSAI